MERRRAVRISKLLSYGLRHAPSDLGLTVDAEGYAPVAEVVASLCARGEEVTRDEVEWVVRTSEKQRFAFSADGDRIRALQGHSIDVDLGLVAREPPPTLHHGTIDRFVASIRAEGLVRGERAHVHLSTDVETARLVGQRRRGDVVILVVRSGQMHRDAFLFFVSQNGVWLTDHVPPRYIDFP